MAKLNENLDLDLDALGLGENGDDELKKADSAKDVNNKDVSMPVNSDPVEESKKKADEALEISEGHNVKSVVYTKPVEENAETFSDKLQQQCEKDAKCRKDQMVVLSNTVSPEDYEKIQEDGFSISESTGKTIVTETDQIKAALAKAGVDISIYGDDLSREQLEEIAGSEAVAIQIKKSWMLP